MRTFLAIFFLFVLMLSAAPAWAVLGEMEASVNSDRQVIKGQIRDESYPLYRVYQITDAQGAVVREYVSLAGQVFAVSWQGSHLPNLQQLLGTYFTHLQQYAQAQTGRQGGPLILRKDDFVFSNAGRMRWSQGRAYVPSLLPAGLEPEVVQ
jgi:hypothetical protein